jgi:hypothetical protein
MTNFHLYYGRRSHLAKNLDLEQLSIPLLLQKKRERNLLFEKTLECEPTYASKRSGES